MGVSDTELAEADTALVEGLLALDDLRSAANVVARSEIADAVAEALRADGRGLREIGRATGLDPAFLSRLSRGEKGATAASLALVALALGKSLKIEIR